MYLSRHVFDDLENGLFQCFVTLFLVHGLRISGCSCVYVNTCPVFVYRQTLRYLAELPPNITTMKNELGMMVSLENLMEK